ncbi:MAG: hypothetical protein ABN482_02705 [Corticimicrobacter sp.]|uniref:hypothetical protein n=1 Tax=Corticimicrobacter sp. TaxID=2678536 RepID=UPI0032DBE392
MADKKNEYSCMLRQWSEHGNALQAFQHEIGPFRHAAFGQHEYCSDEYSSDMLMDKKKDALRRLFFADSGTRAGKRLKPGLACAPAFP